MAGGGAQPLVLRVLAAARRHEGRVVTARSLSRLGTAGALRRALASLSGDGRLCRIRRGMYVATRLTEFGILPPAPDAVVRSYARLTGERVFPNPGRIANWLGFGTQLAIRHVWLTSGRGGLLAVGHQSVELRPAAGWLLANGETPAGWACAALAWVSERERAVVAADLRAAMLSEDWLAVVSTPGMPADVASVVARASTGCPVPPPEVCRLAALMRVTLGSPGKRSARAPSVDGERGRATPRAPPS